VGKLTFDLNEIEYADDCAVVHVISDSLGETANGVVLAAAAQFDWGQIKIERLGKVTNVNQVKEYFDAIGEDDTHPSAVFHTIVDTDLRREVRRVLDDRGIPSIDLLGPAINVMATLTQQEPKGVPGIIHNTDDKYFRRVEAMEFFVEHDDGRNPQDLKKADIVLIGVSRTSKTPLSMYLAFLGFKVANVPLALGVQPPVELDEVDPGRIFGLLSSTDVLADIRQRRLSDDAAFALAGSYADPAEIVAEQTEARALMRRLGCITVHTEKKAVEETANEIIEHIEALDRARESLKNE
jgi:hypothetical protein